MLTANRAVTKVTIDLLALRYFLMFSAVLLTSPPPPRAFFAFRSRVGMIHLVMLRGKSSDFERGWCFGLIE